MKLLLLFILAAFVRPSLSQNEVAGKTFSSTVGKLQFSDNEHATYEIGDGAIVGKFNATSLSLEGKWGQSTGNRSCSTVGPTGTKYWGTISFLFDAVYGSFVATLGECNEEPNKPWRGCQTPRAKKVLTGATYDTIFGALIFAGENLAVYGNGKIYGRLQGNSFVGTWDEPEGTPLCITESLLGSKQWGLVLFKFTDNFESFTGTWDICGFGPSLSWNGNHQCINK